MRATRETLVLATRRELATVSDITSKLGDTNGDPWIFRWDRHEDPTGTGLALIVLSINGSWATPNRHNTAAFPRLQVEVLVDTTRNADMLPTNWTAEERAEAILSSVDRILHRPGGEISWGGYGIVASSRDGEAAPDKVPDKDGLVSALTTYAVSI